MPPPDYPGLKAEAAGPAYSAMDDAAVIAAINAPGPMSPRPVEMLAVLQFAAGTGLRFKMQAVIERPMPPEPTASSTPEEVAAYESLAGLKSLCLGFVDMVWGVGNGRVFDVTDPMLLAMTGALVGAGLMSSGQRDALIHLNAAPTGSIAASLGFVGPPGITINDLNLARSS